jgi:hypothetical protein
MGCRFTQAERSWQERIRKRKGEKLELPWIPRLSNSVVPTAQAAIPRLHHLVCFPSAVAATMVHPFTSFFLYLEFMFYFGWQTLCNIGQ